MKIQPSQLTHTAISKQRREQLLALGLSLPEVHTEKFGELHFAFAVNAKRFAYYLFDHHGDGLIVLHCKAPKGEQGLWVERDPLNYFVPPYVGNKGWLGFRLDLDTVDWQQVESLLVNAYRMTAPKKLLREFDAR